MNPYAKKYNSALRFRFLFYQLIRQYLLVRYRRTYLGFLWTMLLPLLTMTVTSVVFAMITRTPIKDFVPFIFSGLVPWGLFSGMVVQVGSSILNGEGLIRKVYVPTLVFPLSTSVAVLIDSILSMLALLAIVAFFPGTKLGWPLLILPLSLALLFFFSLGIGLICAVLFVFFRDLQHVIGILLQMFFYLTPVVYPIRVVPGKYLWLLNLNPLVFFLDLFRAPLTEGALPSAHALLASVGYAALALLAGLMVFTRFSRRLIFRI
jgi:ABC-2 type transport system permease protein/lipopolysaccharide transport system permease protein